MPRMLHAFPYFQHVGNEDAHIIADVLMPHPSHTDKPSSTQGEWRPQSSTRETYAMPLKNTVALSAEKKSGTSPSMPAPSSTLSPASKARARMVALLPCFDCAQKGEKQCAGDKMRVGPCVYHTLPTNWRQSVACCATLLQRGGQISIAVTLPSPLSLYLPA